MKTNMIYLYQGLKTVCAELTSAHYCHQNNKYRDVAQNRNNDQLVDLLSIYLYLNKLKRNIAIFLLFT